MTSSYMPQCVNKIMSVRILLLLVLGVSLSISVLAPQDSYSIHESEDMKWKLVMVSSYPACSNYHYQMTNLYHDVTEKYLELYEFPNSFDEPECMTEEEFDEFETPSDVDLFIIVYDRNKGRAELHSNEMGGFYNHIGNEWTHNHAIIFCDCSNFQYSAPTWILSHELSHFVLYYSGFDREIVEDRIHEFDKQSDFCVEVEYLESCSDVRFSMETNTHNVIVMTPYDPAVGYATSPEANSDTTIISPFRMQMQQEIAQWWLEGKISDSDFSTSLEILLDKMGESKRSGKSFYSMESKNVMYTDPPKDKKQNNSKHSEEITSSKSAEQIYELLPYKQSMIEKLLSEDAELEEFPLWFKNRAVWWVAGEITTHEFVSGMEYYFNQK